MPQTVAIEARHITHAYGSRRALDDVSFTVEPGSLFGLLGPNGGGKTTLFRIFSTLLRPNGGSAHIRGIDAARNPEATRREIGVVFQAPSLDSKLSVDENLMHQGHLYGYSGAELGRRMDRALDRLSLRDRRRDRVETLSGGLKRRVELAKGLLHDPKVLLLDEPTTGLDAGSRREFKQYLRRLCDAGDVTALLTTHLMDEAELCDRLVILDQGRVVATGTPAELKSTIGGDVVVITAPNPEELARSIAKRFGTEAVVVDETVRLEREAGHTFVPDLIESFPGQIDSVMVSKPTLEDVFVHRTGHRFWEDSGNTGTI